MVNFLIILAGLVIFNFVLLKFSTQSVDGDSKKAKKRKIRINSISEKTQDKSGSSDIPNAA